VSRRDLPRSWIVVMATLVSWAALIGGGTALVEIARRALAALGGLS